MAMMTDTKVNEMIRLGKADYSVQLEYSKLKANHFAARMTRNSEKLKLENCKENLASKQEKADSISILHPIKKYKAIRAVREAKRQYKIQKNNYKIAKANLKNAQIELRSIKAEIRNQYLNIKQNEKMNKRMQRIQQEHYVSPSLADVLEYNKQSTTYATQIYHIDNQNIANNTRVNAPKGELYDNINKTYARHVKEKIKAKSKDLVNDSMDKARQIGSRLKDLGMVLKQPNELGMEM